MATERQIAARDRNWSKAQVKNCRFQCMKIANTTPTTIWEKATLHRAADILGRIHAQWNSSSAELGFNVKPKKLLEDQDD
jgi:hypothetical protein